AFEGGQVGTAVVRADQLMAAIREQGTFAAAACRAGQGGRRAAGGGSGFEGGRFAYRGGSGSEIRRR
ncbi:MAG: hypothetical protein NZ561_03385, partial [Phycisphaerae bacterium]|nr:hypothetical protein [Phycisphaerae bacterium]MDW8261120.1 hypothetical protein [Phycisphaerales bacterium]